MKKITLTLGLILNLVLVANIYAAESQVGEVKETDPCKTNDSKRSQVKGKTNTKESQTPKGTKEQ